MTKPLDNIGCIAVSIVLIGFVALERILEDLRFFYWMPKKAKKLFCCLDCCSAPFCDDKVMQSSSGEDWSWTRMLILYSEKFQIIAIIGEITSNLCPTLVSMIDVNEMRGIKIKGMRSIKIKRMRIMRICLWFFQVKLKKIPLIPSGKLVI